MRLHERQNNRRDFKRRKLWKRPGRGGRSITFLLFLVLTLLASMLLSGCGGNETQVSSIEDLKTPGKSIAVSDGAPEEKQVREDFPEAKIMPFNDMVAAYTAVANGKADACIHSRREMESAIRNGLKGVRLLEESYSENVVAVGISPLAKIPDLTTKINTFLRTLREDGTLDDMYDRWVIRGEETMPEIPKPSETSGTIRIGTTGTVMPYSYYAGNQLAGYDIEMGTRFAAWLGMELKFEIFSFGAINMAAETGEVDCIMSNLYYTKEHDETIDFSDPVFLEDVTAMVKDSGAGAATFFDSIASSFEKTFIREGRWKLLLQGTGVTLLITILSIFFGNWLGFGVYMLCRSGNRISNTITRFLVWLVQGMPIVVFLMILYYIVFGGVNISSTIVAIIGFTLIFGASVYSILKTGIDALNKGQIEAAYSMGFSDRKTFYLILMPQALPHMTRPYTEQITALIKATAVVGYISVQDLTKMGDIIRSRTYEAFFPLITVAIIYFLLAWLLTTLARIIIRRFNARHRKRKNLLKGVKLHD